MKTSQSLSFDKMLLCHRCFSTNDALTLKSDDKVAKAHHEQNVPLFRATPFLFMKLLYLPCLVFLSSLFSMQTVDASVESQKCENLDFLTVSINGEKHVVRAKESLEVVRGDLLVILEPTCDRDSKSAQISEPLRIDVVGFAPKNQTETKGSDARFVIDTAKDLQKKFSQDGKGDEFDVQVKSGQMLLGFIKIKITEPRLNRVVLSINGRRQTLLNGESLKLKKTDQIAVNEV
ncbi:MAG: hypothetical protein NT027_03550, partial [Proteobacteria bacterium]|nr:hypothetical protein [Pseudomonadota bacterium]